MSGMRWLSVFFALSAYNISAFGQTPVAPSAATPMASLKWAGCGASFSDPGFAGWCAIAIPAVQSQGIYSFSLYQFLPNGAKVPSTSTSTGMAIIIRQFPLGRGVLNFLGLGTAGVSTSSTATTASFSGGGIALWKSKGGWTLEAGALENKAGTINKPTWLLGSGITW